VAIAGYTNGPTTTRSRQHHRPDQRRHGSTGVPAQRHRFLAGALAGSWWTGGHREHHRGDVGRCGQRDHGCGQRPGRHRRDQGVGTACWEPDRNGHHRQTALPTSVNTLRRVDPGATTTTVGIAGTGRNVITGQNIGVQTSMSRPISRVRAVHIRVGYTRSPAELDHSREHHRTGR